MFWWSELESGVSNNRLESCVCDTTLISEEGREGLLDVGSVFEADDLPELGVFDSIGVELVVIH